MEHASSPSPRLPPEIRLELLSAKNNYLPKIQEVVSAACTAEGGEPTAWLSAVQDYLAKGEGMIVGARAGQNLIGFMMLEPAALSAPFSWVDPRYRDKGLGQRFYSFACINLAMPTPEFMFPKDMHEEFRPVMKQAGVTPIFKESFYVVHERPAQDAA